MAMYDLAAPQERYLELMAQGGYVEAMEGLGLSFNRANTEYVLRHADEFSSRIEMSLGNVRPLIPLNVDPPQHSKYRKLLDPLFAPKRMDEQEEDITAAGQRLHRHVHRPRASATSPRSSRSCSRRRCSSG